MKNLAIVISILILCFCEISAFAKTQENLQAKDFTHLLGTLDGISDNVLRQHFQLYQGYIKSLNEMNFELKNKKSYTGNASFSEYRSITSSKPFAQNGIVLHELYFSNLSGKSTMRSKQLDELIIRDFGSYEAYIVELKEAAKSARSGWVITGYNTRDGKIYNYVIDLHDVHTPFSVTPLLVFDTWEHSYIADYGIDKDTYINAFIKNINWSIVSERLETVLLARGK